ncbi:MAG: PQQ-binding-like beta-propeller repeat protein, partial [Saprospiraceae bacterium]
KTKGVVEWKVEDLVEDGNSNVRAPLIYDGQIFFQGGKAVYSVDLKTGEKIWEQKFGVPHSFHLGSNLVVVDGILIVNPEDVGVYGVDPKTGEYLWVNSEIGGGPTDMVVNDKYVYFTSNDNQWMYAIDGTTGEVVWKQKSDWSVNSFFQFSAVAVNPDLRHVYASDGYFLFCMEMPE